MKKFTMILIAAIIILSAIGCAAPAATTAPAAGDKTPIKLGWLGALSGDSATWGTADKNGVALTVKQINDAGGILGRPVEMVYYDGKGDQLEYINVLKRLIYEDKVVGVIGQNTSGNQIAMAPIAEEGKVPIISTFATNPKVTVPEAGKLMKYTFRVCFIDPYSGEVTAKFVTQDLKAKNAAVLFDISSDYSTGVKDYFVKAFEALGGKIVAMEALKAGDVDFRPQLTRIKAANPDVIIMPLMFKEVALSANQARELGITTTLVGGDGWPSLQLLEIAGPAVEGSYYLDHADVADPDLAEFRSAYEKEYNRAIEITAIMGHDALMLMKAAIEKAGKAEPEAIRDALENIQGVKVLSGTINMDPETHNPKNKAAVIIKIENGKFVFFKKFQPAE
ncbi:MAG: ABC transporter substrate-binding protein [Anaerolineaceae bacterium]|nr:ABC transporter substrate-binding protein [Anaerolineaceae bacterium]